MKPDEIIARAVQSIPNIRLPMARIAVARILRDLEAEGYEIREKNYKPSEGA